ncbi:MAG: TlpA family protein disulfide reductase [Planctomycetes bacterium]|nr:TlpA family protein disulfide reductase [Planctomycetota bacterium]
MPNEPQAPLEQRSQSGGALRSPWLLVLAALAALPLRAQEPAPAPTPPAVRAERDAAQARLAAAKAEREARLKAEFEAATVELRAAVVRYAAELQRLQEARVPREQWPPHPNAQHYARFEALAREDQPDALRWCLGAIGQLATTPAEAAERKADVYARLVVVHPDQPWMPEVARWLQSDASPGGLGFERANLLLATLSDATTVKANRAAALAARAAILAPRLDPDSRAEHARVVRELAEKHSDTPAGASAKGALFQAEHLAPGRTPPDVEAVDTEGRRFRLSDYRGKVLVLDFWGFWCGPCVRSLPDLAQLAARHAGDPFALVGVATDDDLATFRERAREAQVSWRNAWAGGTRGEWPVSWGVQRYPTIYVFDAQGTVRFVDVRGEELARAVRTLIEEQRAREARSAR